MITKADLDSFNNMLQGFGNTVECGDASSEHYVPPPKPKWELGTFYSLEDARSFAIEHGWRSTPQKVQLKAVRLEGKQAYIIEPFEEDCGCPGIIQPY